MLRKLRAVLVLMLGLVLAGSMVAYGQEGQGTHSASLVIEDVWARPGMVGGTSAIYMSLTNRGETSLKLVDADAPVAGAVEIHETVFVTVTDAMGFASQVMRMQQVPEVEVAPGATVEFTPGGLHVMLLDLQEPLEVGDTFRLTLRFEGSEPFSVPVEVQVVRSSDPPPS